MADDGFVETMPHAKAGQSAAACSIKCTEMGKQKARRLSMTFRLELLDEDTSHILRSGPRFNAAYNPQTKTLRLKADKLGRYETTGAPKTDGKVIILRIPLPAGVHFCGDRIAIDPDPNRQQTSIMFDLPAQFWPPTKLAGVPLGGASFPVQPRRAIDIAPSAMGDPPAGRSALDKRRAGAAGND